MSKRRALLCQCLGALALLLMACAGVQAQAAVPALDISDLEHRLLHAPVEFLIAGRADTLEDVRTGAFQPLTREHVNQGISDTAYWLRVRLENPAAHERVWVLHHETAYLDHLDIHYRDVDAQGRAGAWQALALSDRRPFAERMLPYRKLAFEHRTPGGGATELYLRLGYEKADAVSLNVHLWDEPGFRRVVNGQNLLHGVYFGVMGTLLVFALVCALLLRQMTYVYYAAFLLCSTLMWAMINGFAHQYLWPRSSFWQNEGFHIVYLLMAIFALQFSKSFLQVQRLFPRLHLLLGVLQGIMLLGIALRIAGVHLAVLYLSYAALLLLSLLPLLAWLSYRRGLRYVRWYALAWLIYAAGIVMSVLSAATSLFGWGMEPLVYAQAAGVLEAVLLLMALGERLLGWEVDRKQAVRLASQDALTGLGNRRLLAQAFERLSDRFAPGDEPLFLVLMDVDHFKRINDGHGHEAGDQVLRDMARVLRSVSRAGDVSIRYGGEEFALLLRAPDLEDAVQVAERIRREFEQNPTLYEGVAIRHTLSAGITPVLGAGQRLSAQDMIRRADIALYQAKAAGRNRVVVHNEA